MHRCRTLTASMRRHRQELFALFMIAIVLPDAVARPECALPAFFIGLALAFVLDPRVTVLARRGVPRWGGVLILYAAVVAVIWGCHRRVAMPPITRAGPRARRPPAPARARPSATVEQAIIEWYQSLPLPPDIRETIDAQIAASGDRHRIDRRWRSSRRPINAVVRAADLPARTGRHPGLAVLRPEGPRALQPEPSPRRCLRRLARGRREHAGPAGSRRRPLGARAAPPRARRSSWPPPSASTILTLIGFSEFGAVHPRAGADRRRARVVPDHRTDHRGHPCDPDRPVDQSRLPPWPPSSSTRSSSSSRTTSWCRR